MQPSQLLVGSVQSWKETIPGPSRTTGADVGHVFYQVHFRHGGTGTEHARPESVE